MAQLEAYPVPDAEAVTTLGVKETRKQTSLRVRATTRCRRRRSKVILYFFSCPLISVFCLPKSSSGLGRLPLRLVSFFCSFFPCAARHISCPPPIVAAVYRGGSSFGFWMCAGPRPLAPLHLTSQALWHLARLFASPLSSASSFMRPPS